MTIKLAQNPYRGVNAHFQSYLQHSEESWRSFHTPFITHLTQGLNALLPEAYYAVTEYSLQIDPALKEEPEEMDEVEEGVLATNIYHMTMENERRVTRLELLSPSTKHDPAAYFDRRAAAFRDGVSLVEIDFLHEAPAIFRDELPDYAAGEEGAFPYVITLTRAGAESPATQFHGLHVDEVMPVLEIPLAGDESFRLDVEEVYQFNFSADERAHLLLDYAELPRNVESYMAADRERIEAVMARVRAAVGEG
jgi:hypothetical protein